MLCYTVDMKLKTFPVPLILFLALLFSFTVYSAVDVWRSNQEIKMPEQFLGYWEPYSRALANVGLEISADGTLKDVTNDKAREVLGVKDYKVFYVDPQNRAYILIKSNNGIGVDGKNFTYVYYWILEQRYQYSVSKLIFYTPRQFGYDVIEDDWFKPNTFHIKRMIDYLSARENDFRRVPFGVYARDK